MTDKVVTFPVIEGGKDCDEAEVMILLGKASDANLTKVVIIGCTEDGDIFRGSNFSELETVGMLFNAALLACVEDED